MDKNPHLALYPYFRLPLQRRQLICFCLTQCFRGGNNLDVAVDGEATEAASPPTPLPPERTNKYLSFCYSDF